MKSPMGESKKTLKKKEAGAERKTTRIWKSSMGKQTFKFTEKHLSLWSLKGSVILREL